MVHGATVAALQSLRERKLLSFRPPEGQEGGGPQWLPTQMGRSVFESGMETEAGIALFKRLEHANSSGLLGMRNDGRNQGALHLIFMVIQASPLPTQLHPHAQTVMCSACKVSPVHCRHAAVPHG